MRAKFINESINKILKGKTPEEIKNSSKFKQLYTKIKGFNFSDYGYDDSEKVGDEIKNIIKHIFGSLPADPNDSDQYHPFLIQCINDIVDFKKFDREEFWEGMVDWDDIR